MLQYILWVAVTTRVVENAEKVLAIELLLAAQALEYRRPLRSSDKIEAVMSAYVEIFPLMMPIVCLQMICINRWNF